VVLSVLGLGTLGGCVPGLSSPEAPPPPPGPLPGPLPWPVAAVEHPVFDTLPSPTQLPPPVVEAARDELLESSVRHDPAFEEAVEWWVRYWRGPASGWFPDFLARMARLGQVVDSALAREGLPASLRYLPLIESGYNPLATSPVRAAGLWQFMAPTAREFGMEVTPLLDERRDPFKSTEAALRYLGELRERFDSWFLALAAYNSGPARVSRVLRRHAPLDPRSDSLFWALREHFPRETREFLPKLYGAMRVAQAPEAHGYTLPPHEPLVFDEVSVPDATTLDVVARAAEVTEAEIFRLNPAFVRGMTPPGRPVAIRVPAGRGATFELNYALVPPGERVSFVEHVVSDGETPSHIAVRYGISVSDLQAANPDVRPRRMRVGMRLTVPVGRRASGSGQ